MTKKTIVDFRKMKADGVPVAWVTAYNYWQAMAAERAGVDMILCGDSYGNVECGHASTIPVELNEMLRVTQNARRGAPNTFIVGDFPMGCYEESDEQAVRSAVAFVKAGADAVKLERASGAMLSRISAIADAGILVCGHLGVTPQTAMNLTGGYRCAGKTKESFGEIFVSAEAVMNFGASFLLLEGMPELAAKEVTKSLGIPVYGIGAGCQTDGSLMIFHDLCGLFPDFRPYFGKCFVPEVIGKFTHAINCTPLSDMKKFGRSTKEDGLMEISTRALAKYVEDVRSRAFPSLDYTYPLKEDELIELRKSPLWNRENE